jgi:glutathione S-transferase
MWGLPNFSQACLKLETWLRMAGIPYEAAPGDLRAAPKGKVPYILDDGELLGDSTLIIEHLKAKYGKDPDAPLGKSERAVSLAFRRMIKENLFWSTHYSRYFDDRGWPIYKSLLIQLFVPDAPAPEQERRMAEFQEYMRGQINGHGMGRHTQEQIYQIGVADITAVADFLGDKPFFMGEAPTTVDATVYGHIANILAAPIESPLKEHGLKQPNLVRHCERMLETFYPELHRADAGPP